MVAQPGSHAGFDSHIVGLADLERKERSDDFASLRLRAGASNPCSAVRSLVVLFATVSVERAGWTVLSITGECDLASAPEFRREVSRAAMSATRVVLDLSGLDLIDSVGLGLIVGVARRVERLVVVVPVGRVRDVFAVTRLDEILDVRDEFDPS